MRIVQVLEATLAGTARHVLDLSIGLRRAGHEVHLLFNPRPGRMDAIFAAGLPLLEREGVALHAIDMPRSVGLSDARVVSAVRAYLRRHGPFDVVHGHSSKGGAYVRLGAIGLPGVRVYTPNALITTNPQLGAAPRLVYALMERILGWLGDGVIAVSAEERDESRRLGIGDDRLFLVPNGSDVEPADPAITRARTGLPDRAFVLGFIGRLVPQKAPSNLIEALAILAPRFPDVRLAVVGAGPLESSVRSRAEALGIGSRIHWLGPIDGPSVMPLFDLCVLPSLYEGFPYVLIEALNRGLPIVTTAVGGASAMVEHEGNGLIVPVERPDLLAEAIGRMVADPEARARMAARSRALSGQFTAERMVAGNLEVYEKLTRRSRDRA